MYYAELQWHGQAPHLIVDQNFLMCSSSSGHTMEGWHGALP